MQKKVLKSYRLDADLVESIRQYAHENKMKHTDVVEESLRQYLNDSFKNNQEVVE